jgi:N-acetylmuramoyl-L-alanine amidase
LILFSLETAQAATVKTLRIWQAEDQTRLVLDLDAPVDYSLVVANNPTRIILTITSTRFDRPLDKLPLAGTPIEVVRKSIVNDNDLRLVFDLKKAVSPKSFLLKKNGDSDDRLVIDLLAASETPKNSDSAKANSVPDDEPANIESVMIDDKPSDKNVPDKTIKSTNNGKSVLIILDPGHGGEDPGALGPNRLREKDVTLAISKALANIINSHPGYTARLTRTTDMFIPLQKRRDFARDVKADLFISIHADSFTDPSADGASVYALSRKGATSEMARFLAQHENESDLVGRVGNVSLEDKDPQLAGVLVDLSMNATVNTSLQLGSTVLSSLGAISPLHSRHVEQAGFVVLKSPDVPSILVETGFISNKSEAKKLASPLYQKQLAQAIFNGVREFLARHPLSNSDTPIASQTKPATPIKSSSAEKNEILDNSRKGKNAASERKHLVVRGDTLVSIATKYRVRAKDIKLLNRMKSDTVKLGLTLKIPAPAQ